MVSLVTVHGRGSLFDIYSLLHFSLVPVGFTDQYFKIVFFVDNWHCCMCLLFKNLQSNVCHLLQTMAKLEEIECSIPSKRRTIHKLCSGFALSYIYVSGKPHFNVFLSIGQLSLLIVSSLYVQFDYLYTIKIYYREHGFKKGHVAYIESEGWHKEGQYSCGAAWTKFMARPMPHLLRSCGDISGEIFVLNKTDNTLLAFINIISNSARIVSVHKMLSSLQIVPSPNERIYWQCFTAAGSTQEMVAPHHGNWMYFVAPRGFRKPIDLQLGLYSL